MPVCPIMRRLSSKGPMYLTLNTGAKMPALGLGTWQQATSEEALEKALDTALETGYRHFDTAAAYENEHIIGKVLKKWLDSGKIRREDLFIVTKLPPCGNRPSSVEKYMKKSLEKLQLDYVDLYLVHQPVGFIEVEGNMFPLGPDGKILIDKDTDIIAVWRCMEDQVDAGRAKAIGISNFNEKQIQRVLDVARIKPANLQVEIHVYFQQHPLVEFCHKKDISVVGYASLGSRGAATHLKAQFGETFNIPDLLENQTVLSIAKKHKKQAAHVLLRHLLQRGIATIPKSTNPERIISNFQVFDFELDKADMEALNKLDQGAKGRALDSALVGMDKHPEYPF